MNDIEKDCHNLTIGAVGYLNTKPLVYGLANLLPSARIIYDYPSRLADALAAGELDVALVPSVELARHPEWSIISDACIGCRGPVLSVKLLFRVKPDAVRSLALDEGSRTSAVLAQVLLSEISGSTPQLVNLELGKQPAESNADAVLVIGDRAIRELEGDFVETWDLGDRWCRWAELPFVFAMWVARPGVNTAEAAVALAASREQGCNNLSKIASQQAKLLHLPEAYVLEYLSRNLYFYLGERELQGLQYFYDKAAEQELILSRFTPSVVRVD